jgi:hypothetical protein
MVVFYFPGAAYYFLNRLVAESGALSEAWATEQQLQVSLLFQPYSGL